METYSKLFSIRLRHQYFANGDCPEFVIKPDRQTQESLRKNGLLFREIPSGLVILAESVASGNDILLSEKIETDIQCNFILEPKDPLFLNFTEVQELAKETFLLCTNNEVEQQQQSVVFKTGLSAGMTSEGMPGSATGESKFHILRNGKELSYNMDELDEHKLDFVVKALDQGLYQFRSGDELSYRYHSMDHSVKLPFALISIQLDHENIMNAAGVLNQPEFILGFEAKRTNWQYIISLKQQVSSLIIDSQEGLEEFESTEKELENGQRVISFTSISPILITEKRESYFRLILRNGDPQNDQVLISKLPLPDRGVYARKMDGKLITPIYVNL